ncbi:hypothetical protein ACJX0J_037918, partial [Zea mays]
KNHEGEIAVALFMFTTIANLISSRDLHVILNHVVRAHERRFLMIRAHIEMIEFITDRYGPNSSSCNDLYQSGFQSLDDNEEHIFSS